MTARPGLEDAAGRFELLARACDEMRAPLYASMARSAADDYRNGGPVAGFFAARPQLLALSTIGLRLMAAVHYDALSGAAPGIAAHYPSCGGDGDPAAAWAAVRAWIAARGDDLARRCQATPQTNEVARSVPLLGGALAIAARTQMPLRLFDVGSSAGLNARLDCYRYEGNGWAWGDASSPLVLSNRELGGAPSFLDANLVVESRAACDLHPLDIAREEDRLTLRSYVWPDQLERFDRLNRAIEAASREPLVVERADMLEWILQRTAPRGGTATVLMHSIVCEHLTGDVRTRFLERIRAQGELATPQAPFAWLRLEKEDEIYGTRLTFWPGNDTTMIATSDGHAQNLRWSATQ